MADKPVLWHIPVSHYNEKARWALDYKRVEHERRTPPPPSHMAVALWLTRGSGKTFPVLQMDGEVYGDSSEIIAALERACPEPALYPEDPGARREALEIEDFFDEGVAPHLRLLVWHEAIKDREAWGRFASATLPSAMRGGGERFAGAVGSSFVRLRYGVADPDAAREARDRIEAGMARIDAALAAGGDYLVGNSFSVADLTAAAIMYPIAMPPEGPRALVEVPPPFDEFRRSFAERPSYAWIADTFRRHRKPARVAAAV
jgi:glutathione S-transferase